MTGDKKPGDDVPDIEWDQALAEWENASFATDDVPDAVIPPPVAAAISRPLYRPPSAPSSAKMRQTQKPTLPPVPVVHSFDDGDEEATMIAVIPAELLRSEDTPARQSSRGGGLGQFFARDSVAGPGAPNTDSGTAFENDESVEIEAVFDPITGARTRPSMLFGGPDANVVARSAPIPIEDLDPNEEAFDPSAKASENAHESPVEPADVVATDGAQNPGGDGERRPPDETLVSSLAPAPARAWLDERPASVWLDEEARAALEDRAAWLEEEARALPDPADRAQGLLTCSELLAIVGDRVNAQTLAAEARDLAPTIALAHRQARALLPWPQDPEDFVEALDTEVKLTPAGPARVHSALLAADASRGRGDGEGAEARLEQAMSTAPSDVRIAIARTVNALANFQAQTPPPPSLVARLPLLPSLRRSDHPHLVRLAQATDVALRLRTSDAESLPDETLSLSDLVQRARRALHEGEAGDAAPIVAELARAPELGSGARWLAAALGATRRGHRRQSVRWLRELLDRGEPDAHRALLARALELDDGDSLAQSIAKPGAPLTSADRITLAALASVPLLATDPHLDTVDVIDELRPLVGAVTAVATPPDNARATRTAGSPASRAEIGLGRLLASLADTPQLESALAALGEPKTPSARGIAIEVAFRAGHGGVVSQHIEAWGQSPTGERPEAALAAALVAERSHDIPQAIALFQRARLAEPTSEAPLRALASLEPTDLVSEMNALADSCADGIRAALARIEAVARGERMLAEPVQAQLLERAYRAAPQVPIAPFLGERLARRAGDVEEVLRWVRERRSTAADPIEMALDSVREALLIADRDPQLASERLREAQQVRPRDVALRDLYERMATEAPDDRGAWREQRASEATGDARVLLSLEAAHEHERVRDYEGAFRCSVAAAMGEASLGRIARERAELRTERVARLTDELLERAREANDLRARREAYERLAVLDATARHDTASALLWHRSILEEVPEHKPSLRYVEHQLIGEGRDGELEPIAIAIATSLAGTGPGEATAHADLAARLGLRGGGDTKIAREMMNLAVDGPEVSLWSLRARQSDARAQGDDVTFLTVTKRLVDRVTRSAEIAWLLVRAGEAAIRLGLLDEARWMLERATIQDPGDIVAWLLLAEVRLRNRDARGAAEAYEALARASAHRAHQLAAWYDAGRLWSDEANDEDRALAAWEATAALDVAYRDVFDRLSRLYATRRLPTELADLLERRVERVTDPEERLTIEVQRGRVLLEVGEVDEARRAFEAALKQRPDDPSALSAFADLCSSQSDWEAAEQALVRLARRLPTPEEQRGVYARLGEIYSNRLLNLSRAEVAFKEVLKRAPNDDETAEKLVEVYKRQNDPARAIELQQSLVERAQSSEEKHRRIVALALLHEKAARDPRRAEKTLEDARREFPHDVGFLRALVEFYARHQQTPAMNIVLDRASADARRDLAADPLTTAPFEMVAAVFDLRGNDEAARTARAILAAVEAAPAELPGVGAAALDAQLDDAFSPESLGPSLRALLAKMGDALDAAAPLDLRELHAARLASDSPLARMAEGFAATLGMGEVRVMSCPTLVGACIPLGSSPPTLLVAEGLDVTPAVAAFLVVRALKLVMGRASALGRLPPVELSALLSAWVKCLHPTWEPTGQTAGHLPALQAAYARLQACLPRVIDPDVTTLALEVGHALDASHTTLGLSAHQWANRVALLCVGDPNAALDAIAIAGGSPDGAPRDPKERIAFIARTEARDLMAFGVSEAFAVARGRLSLAG